MDEQRTYTDWDSGRTGTRLATARRSEEHTSELQSPCNLVCRLLLEKKKHTKHSVASFTTQCSACPLMLKSLLRSLSTLSSADCNTQIIFSTLVHSTRTGAIVSLRPG